MFGRFAQSLGGMASQQSAPDRRMAERVRSKLVFKDSVCVFILDWRELVRPRRAGDGAGIVHENDEVQ
jgi:hypothetical protein